MNRNRDSKQDLRVERAMNTRMTTLVAFALVASCGPGNELIGRWSADLRATFAPAEAAQYASFVTRVTFSGTGTYLMETRATAIATATNGAGCTTVLVSWGGRWSVAVMNSVNALTTVAPVNGTAERFGCRNSAENFAPQPTGGAATLQLASGTYTVSGNTLVHVASGGSNALTFTRE